MTNEEFWKRVAPPNTNGCRLWTGALRDKKGYGGVTWRGKAYRTHRLAYILTYGEISSGLYVCHKCDVRACCNPEHLFLGTQTDNMRDMVRKGRNAKLPDQRGETNRYAKLTVADVKKIRASRERGLTYGQIGRIFSIRPSHAYNIVMRRQWGHVP